MSADSKKLIQTSKKLSWALRHGIKELGIAMNSAGYVKLNDLLLTAEFRGATIELIENVVSSDNKSRYSLLKENGEIYIRANQGHSIKEVKDEELLTLINNPDQHPIVIHGTNKASWKIIKSLGLYRMERNHIHFAKGLPGANQVISGARVNCEVFIFIDIRKAMNDGIQFFISQNNVILSSGINGFLSPKYFDKVIINKNQVQFQHIPIEFDYFLILDFEANCVENGVLPCQEIIEFPVKALNRRTLQVDYIFHHYVKPEVVPTLTQFCTNLTGITQEMVENQDIIVNVLEKFHQFLTDTNLISAK